MYEQVLDPGSHSSGLTSIFAVLPLIVLLMLLDVLRMKAQWAALLTLGVATLVAIVVDSMPLGQAGDGALEGAVFGFWPIMWIVINGRWIFNMTEVTGNFAVLRRAFSAVSDDQRVQVVVIAFCFGAAGRPRRDRDPHHHRAPGHRAAGSPPQADGRAPDPVPGSGRPVRAGVHGRQAPGPA